MEILEAYPEDFPEIENLVRRIWEPTYRHLVPQEQIEYMEELMHRVKAYRLQMDDGHHFYKAMIDGKIAGMITFYENGTGLKIPKLYVDGQIQQKGIGKSLLEKAIEFCINNNMNYIELNVNRYNKALYFYRRMGFYIHSSVDIPLDKFWLNDYVMRMDVR